MRRRCANRQRVLYAVRACCGAFSVVLGREGLGSGVSWCGRVAGNCAWGSVLGNESVWGRASAVNVSGEGGSDLSARVAGGDLYQHGEVNVIPTCWRALEHVHAARSRQTMADAKIGYVGPHEVVVGKKSLRLCPGGERVSFNSPRFRRALAESGVRLDDLRPVRNVKQVTKPGCEQQLFREVAHVRLAAFERDRLAHVDAVLRARQRMVDGVATGKKTFGEREPAAVQEEEPSSMIAKIQEDVAKMEAIRAHRLQMDEKMAQEAERISAENAAAQARRDAELQARQEAGAAAMAAKGAAAAEKVRLRDERIAEENRRQEERERQSLIEQEEQLAAFEAQRQRFVARRRKQQRDTEKRNAEKVARKERNQAERQARKEAEAAKRAEDMAEKTARLAANRAQAKAELEEKNEAQRQKAQARLEDDAKKAVQQLEDQWQAFETKTNNLRRRQEEKAEQDAKDAARRKEEEMAAKAKAQAARDEIKRKMTEAMGAQMSKREADNLRVQAAMRRRQCQFQVAAERSRSRWASKKEIVRRYQRRQNNAWVEAMDRSDEKMRMLDDQLAEKAALYEEKRKVVLNYALNAERAQFAREREARRPKTAPQSETSFNRSGSQQKVAADNLCYGRPIDSALGAQHTESSISLIMAGRSAGSKDSSVMRGGRGNSNLEMSLSRGTWVI